MEKEFKKNFDRCPLCKLREELAQILGKPELMLPEEEEGFFAALGEELKERGIARNEWNFRLDIREGIVVDPEKKDSLPIGTEVPSFGMITDICLRCGCVYAICLARSNVKKPPPSIAVPNRAQRRQASRGDQGPGLINPFSQS